MSENYNPLDKELNRLVQVIARLRAEDGCPWDREQTHGSLKAACVEEAAEVVGGINILEQTGNAENLKEELGDLLLQVVMHAQIAKEEGLFTLEDVMRGITDKMIRRHPHVFETTAVSGSDEVLVNWAEIKKQEKEGKEWMESYLPGAFDEAEELIGAARKRKGCRTSTSPLHFHLCASRQQGKQQWAFYFGLSFGFPYDLSHDCSQTDISPLDSPPYRNQGVSFHHKTADTSSSTWPSEFSYYFIMVISGNQ